MSVHTYYRDASIVPGVTGRATATTTVEDAVSVAIFESSVAVTVARI